VVTWPLMVKGVVIAYEEELGQCGRDSHVRGIFVVNVCVI
jgi:hypothetical protein